MREVLEDADKICYYSFLMSLAKHESINQTIGRFDVTQVETSSLLSAREADTEQQHH